MPDHFYIYPAYLDRANPRSMGRRVPNAEAPPEVTLEEIAAAAQALGMKATPEPDKQYPRTFFRYQGRVRVTKKTGLTKATFLRSLGREILRRRGSAGKE